MIDKSLEPLLSPNDIFVGQLNKALYGCIQSARLWFEKLRSVLCAYGFVTIPCDECVMNKNVNGVQITVGFHVDALLMTCIEESILDDVSSYLKENFQEVKEKNKNVMAYLGMRISL